MATPSVNNNNDKIHMECMENLVKAEALIDVALQIDISDIPTQTIHDYLWALSDFVKQALQAHEKLGL